MRLGHGTCFCRAPTQSEFDLSFVGRKPQLDCRRDAVAHFLVRFPVVDLSFHHGKAVRSSQYQEAREVILFLDPCV